MNNRASSSRLQASDAGLLRVYRKDVLVSEHVVKDMPLLLGRSPQCDIILADAAVGKRHAKLIANNGVLKVRDLGSAEGLLVNGQQLSEFELASKSDFGIGPYVITFISVDDLLQQQNVGPQRQVELTQDRTRERRSNPPVPPQAQPVQVHATSIEASETTIVTDVLAAVLDYWRPITATVFAAALLGVLHGMLTVPQYQANAIVQIQPRDRDIGGPFADFDNSRRINDSLIDEAGVLGSRRVLGEVVDRLDMTLKVRPVYFPDFGYAFGLPSVGTMIARYRDSSEEVADPLFNLEQFAWGGERITVETLEVPESFQGETFTLVALGSDSYRITDQDNNRLAEGLVGEVLESWLPEGEGGQLLISELVANRGTQFRLTRIPRLLAIENLQYDLNITDAGPESRILELSLVGGDPTRISSILNEVVTIYVQDNVATINQEAVRILQFVQGQIPVAKENLEQAEARLSDLQLQRGSVDLSSDTEVVLEKIVRLESRLVNLQQARAELVERFTAQHPRMISLDEQITALRSELYAAEQAVRELPTTQREVVSAQREVAVASELYVNLVNRELELQVVSDFSATTGNVRVVDYAAIPLQPFKPNKKFLLIIYMMLGIALSTGIALLYRLLRNVVHDPELIETRLNLPIFATLPFSNRQESIAKRAIDGKVPILAITDPKDLAIEGLRSLRTSLQFAFINAKNNILLVTGPTAGVGKTFVAANLATVLAQSGKTVVVVDADLRRGVLHRQFGTHREPGLADTISTDMAIREVTEVTMVDGLFIVGAGAYPTNPSETLMDERFQQQIADLSSRYDHVIIDSPPVLAVTDPALISRIAGVVLLVAKAGVHPMREIEQSVKKLQRVGANLRGIVFNSMPVSAGTAYGYGSHTNYSAKDAKV